MWWIRDRGRVEAWKGSIGRVYSRKSSASNERSTLPIQRAVFRLESPVRACVYRSILNREWTGALFIAGIKTAATSAGVDACARSTNKAKPSATFSFLFTSEVKRFPNCLSLRQYRKLLRRLRGRLANRPERTCDLTVSIILQSAVQN